MGHLLRTLCLALLLPALAAHASPARPPGEGLPPGRVSFRTYGPELGLSNVSVYQLVQDRRGFIWAGTDAGLFRYDGHRFARFGLAEGLPSTEIMALHEDRRGVLWVGTRQGLARWDGYALAAAGPEMGMPAIAITGLVHSGDVLWVGTDSGPFVRASDGGFAKASGWQGGAVTSLWASPVSGRVWVASWDGSAHVHVHDARGWQRIELPAGMAKESIDAMAEDGSGQLWARASRTLWLLDRGSSRFRGVDAPFPLASDRGHVQAGKHGDIWIPTQSGLVHVEGDRWTRLTGEEGLPTTWVRSILVDHEGSLWVGSTGLFRLLGRRAWRGYTRADGLPSDIIWSFFRDRSGQLWSGTDDGAALATGAGWAPVPGFEGRGLRTILQAADGMFYLAGTPGTDVVRYDPTQSRLQVFRVTSAASPKRIFRLMLDDRQRLWAGTDGAGMFRADSRGAMLDFKAVSLPGGTASELVRDIHQDAQGRIWVAGENGLALLENDRWRRFQARDGLRNDSTSFVRSTRNGDLLVSYNDPLGVTRMRYRDGKLHVLHHFDTTRGLADDKVYMFGEDAKDRIWIGTPKGIDLVQAAGIEHFGAAEGLVSEDVNNMAFLAEPNGDVWVGTSGGIAYFDDSAYPGIGKPPRTEFLSLKLGPKTYRGDEQKARAPFDASMFEARFSSLNFVRETGIHQEVRLLGLEPEWRATDTHEARYSALPYGDYRFEVRSRVGQGPPGPIAAFEFEVLRPWWHAWWFRALAALAAVGLILLLVRWRMRALQQQNRMLEQLVASRTKELEASNDALKNQSLTDPLTGLRNRRFVGECILNDVAHAIRLSREAKLLAADRMTLNIDLLFVMVDLDHFKQVNDEHGHAAGDRVLQQMALVLEQASRDSDTVVRWGGEEFMIIGRGVCRRDFTVLAERIRSRVAELSFDLGNGEKTRLTCSIGLAVFPFLPEEPEALPWERVVDLADACMYTAKRSGRNAWVGIRPAGGADAARLTQVSPGSIPALIDQGVVFAQASTGTARLDWGNGG